jgi:hypothetical protein
MADSDLALDGNAAAGLLAMIFAVEMTTAETVCDGCGAVGPLAELVVYESPMGTVIRCPGCDAVLLRVAEIRGRYRLDLRGLRLLTVSRSSQVSSHRSQVTTP